jgi:hypothetical protein
MGTRKNNRKCHDASTQQRRNEVASLLVAGMLRAEPAIKPLSEILSQRLD